MTVSLTRPTLSSPSVAPQPGAASVCACDTPLLAAHPLPAGAACLMECALLSFPISAGHAFLLVSDDFFSFQGCVLQVLSHGAGAEALVR